MAVFLTFVFLPEIKGFISLLLEVKQESSEKPGLRSETGLFLGCTRWPYRRPWVRWKYETIVTSLIVLLLHLTLIFESLYNIIKSTTNIIGSGND